MKTVSKVAICGLLAFALQTTANAQSVQVEQGAVRLMQESQIAKKFLEQKLGVKTGSVADVNAALGKLSAAERAGVVAAINSYASQAVLANGNSNLISQDEKAARAAFTTGNGQLIEVAALVKSSSSRSAVTAKAIEGKTCNLDEAAQDLSAGTKVSQATAASLISKHVINLMGECGKDVRQMGPAARGNLLTAADCADRQGVTSITTAAGRDEVYGRCLQQALRSNEGDTVTSETEAVQRVKDIRANCGYFN
jgi:hypothetical protein